MLGKISMVAVTMAIATLIGFSLLPTISEEITAEENFTTSFESMGLDEENIMNFLTLFFVLGIAVVVVGVAISSLKRIGGGLGGDYESSDEEEEEEEEDEELKTQMKYEAQELKETPKEPQPEQPKITKEYFNSKEFDSKEFD